MLVAVKTMKQGSSRETAEDFRKQMEIAMDFDHPNVVRLLGICTRDEPLYLITEAMKQGDLKDYIRKAYANETPDVLFSRSRNSSTSPLRRHPASPISRRARSFIATSPRETLSSAKTEIS